MNAHLQHAALVAKENDDFTLSPDKLLEFWALPYGLYGFRAETLAGEKEAEMTGTYVECRHAWRSVSGYELPHHVDRRRV